MARLRYNGLRAMLGGSGLTLSGTTITFTAALTYNNGANNVPTIGAGDYIPLGIIDPTTGRLAEVIYLTAYTSGATTGTITRYEEGSYIGFSRPAGCPVIHDALEFDFGDVTAFTTAWTGSGSNPVLNNGTNVGWYTLLGPLCYFTFIITIGSTTNIGSGNYTFTYPVTVGQAVSLFGTARNGGNPFALIADGVVGSTSFQPKAYPTTAGTAFANMTAAVPAAWAAGAIFRFSGLYLWA